MIQRIRKNQRKTDNKKSIKAKKSRYKPKNKKVIRYKPPTIYDDYIDKIIKKIIWHNYHKML